MNTERIYAFKLAFARYMVETYGSFSDYKRVRDVEKEARRDNYEAYPDHPAHYRDVGGANIITFPSPNSSYS